MHVVGEKVLNYCTSFLSKGIKWSLFYIHSVGVVAVTSVWSSFVRLQFITLYWIKCWIHCIYARGFLPLKLPNELLEGPELHVRALGPWSH